MSTDDTRPPAPARPSPLGIPKPVGDSTERMIPLERREGWQPIYPAAPEVDDPPMRTARRVPKPAPWDRPFTRPVDQDDLHTMSEEDRMAAVRAQWGAPVTVNVQQPAPAAQQPNHLLHAVVSILTGGLWLPVWFVVNRRAKRAARRG